MKFFAKHGVSIDEKILGQEFLINLEMECILDKVFESDLILRLNLKDHIQGKFLFLEKK